MLTHFCEIFAIRLHYLGLTADRSQKTVRDDSIFDYLNFVIPNPASLGEESVFRGTQHHCNETAGVIKTASYCKINVRIQF